MRRRTFITAAGTCGFSAMAGCLSTGTAPGTEGNRHPFADSTLAVRIDVNGETPHNIEAIARESLAFWEEHSREYVDFGVEFDVVDEEPDVIITYADDASACSDVENYSEQVLGCAPLIRPGGQVRRPVTAYVVASYRPIGEIRTTTKHELGHIFGLDHDDEPRWIMSNRPEDRIPLYGQRIDIWETVIEAQNRGILGNQQFDDGAQAWQNGEYEAAEGAFRSAHESYGEMREFVTRAQEDTAVFEGHERAETVNLPRLRSLLNSLYRRASAAEWFSFHMSEAARGVRAEDSDAAERALMEANDWIREYNDVGPTQIRDIAIALGLVRGFDRDDAVLDGEEDELDSEEAGV